MNPEIDLSSVVLHTARLTLRPWRPSDLDDLYAYARVDGVGQMAGWEPHKSIEMSAYILNRFIREKKTFALEYEGRAVGSLGVEEYDETRFPELSFLRCREIGYVLAKELWGRGLMPEAVGEALRYAFGVLRLDAVLCGHFLSNPQSARVQEKCGFGHYAFGSYRTQMGTMVDDEVTILTKEQWEQTHGQGVSAL